MPDELSDRFFWIAGRLLVGAAVGGLLGALNPMADFSLRRLLAGVVSGATFGSIVGLLVIHIRRNSVFAFLCVFAGCYGGLAYWAVVRPEVHPLPAVILGAALGLLWAWGDGVFGSAEEGRDGD